MRRTALPPFSYKTLERNSLLFHCSRKTPAHHGMLAVKLLRPCTLLKLQSLPQYQICKQYMTAASSLFLCSQFFSGSPSGTTVSTSVLEKRLRAKPDEFQLRCNDSAKSNVWMNIFLSFSRSVRPRNRFCSLKRSITMCVTDVGEYACTRRQMAAVLERRICWITLELQCVLV